MAWRALVELTRPLVAKILPGVYKELLIKRLAETVDLETPKLQAILAKDQVTQTPPVRREGLGGLRHKSKPSAGKPNIVRHAISLLLNYPDAADKLDIEQIAGVIKPGTELLRDLIETVQAEPNMTTAGLLERWRTHAEGRHLGKLAAVELPVSEDFDAAAELEQCIAQLALAGKRERVDYLIEKERLSTLSDAERSELRELGPGPAYGG